MSMIVAFSLFAPLFLVSYSRAATYFLDASQGNDRDGDGSVQNPFQTWSGVRGLLTGGDVVNLAPGNYGSIEEGIGPKDVFKTWVTVHSIIPKQAVFTDIRFGYNGSAYGSASGEGVYDIFMRFENVKVVDGVEVFGGRNLLWKNCSFERLPPWTGSDEAIEKMAVRIRNGSFIKIEDCEITRTPIGVCASGNNIEITGSHIHDITHDGIRCVGLQNSLIEGNRIHGMDDGIEDSDASWSRHCDAIHIYISGANTESALLPNKYLTIRGNTIYDAESQGIQFNNYYKFPDVWNENITIENNVFGPTRAIAVNNAQPVNGFIFRHNTFITGAHSYTNPNNESHRTIQCENSTLRLSDDTTGVQVYNNILGVAPGDHQNAIFFDYNLIQQPDDGVAYKRFTSVGEDPLFVNPWSFDGRISSESPAVDTGTRLVSADTLEVDMDGVGRDERPDMGAREISGRDPTPESTPLPTPSNPTVFVEDFEDADFDQDAYLNGSEQQGLTWYEPTSSEKPFSFTRSTESRNELKSPIVGGAKSIILSNEGQEWSSYRFAFAATNGYATDSVGPIFLAQTTGEGYFLDIGLYGGTLSRRLLNTTTGEITSVTLASSTAIRLPNSGRKNYVVTVQRTDASVQINVSSNGGLSNALSYLDTDPDALSRLKSGRVGFFKEYARNYHGVSYDDIQIQVAATISVASGD